MGGVGTQVRPVNTDIDDSWQQQLANQKKQIGSALANNGLSPPEQRQIQAGPAYLAQAAQAAPPAVAQAAQSNFGGFAQGAQAAGLGQQQQSLARMLGQAASGQGPSMAGQAIGQGVAASLAAQNAAAGSARGANLGSVLTQSAQDAMATRAQGAIAAGQARIQEQQAAQQALGQVLESTRAQELGIAQQQASMGLQNAQFNAANQQATNLANQQSANAINLQNAAQAQQTALANQGSANATNALNAQLLQSAMAGNQQAAIAWKELQNKQQMGLMGLDNALTQQGWGMNLDIQNMRQQANLYNAGASDAGAAYTNSQVGAAASAGLMLAMMASDERVKTDVKTPSRKQIGEFLSAARPHSYRYTDPKMPGAGEGVYFSPMAQELEKSELGKAMVQNVGGVKMVNYQRGLGAILAAQADMHDRLAKLEGRKGK